MLPKATIVFTTHNRREFLHQAIHAAQNQSVPVKILIMDDASSDGTQEMMSKEFPEIEYHRSSENRGPCYHRNRGVELANTEVVFPLDDDSILQSPYTVEQTLAEFDHSRIGAVAIPFCNILQTEKVNTQAPDKSQVYLTHAFVAAAHAVLKSAFLKAGGYQEFFFYMGEEGDLCIRLMQNNFFVRLGTSDPIHHFQHPNRVSVKADVFGRQNDILFLYCNASSQYLLPYLLGTSVKGILYGIKVKRPINMLKGLVQGFKLALTDFSMRSPVNSDCFQLYRMLKQRECVPLVEVEHYFQ
ncbi:glycosyltransferase family 2 protein [Nostoc sp.]|uniref:glycosyltransferase family 2 protein n=1 Tax=Nostoc sp. TaxID=1180 RepID=UPI002FF72D50